MGDAWKEIIDRHWLGLVNVAFAWYAPLDHKLRTFIRSKTNSCKTMIVTAASESAHDAQDAPLRVLVALPLHRRISHPGSMPPDTALVCQPYRSRVQLD